MVLNGPNLDLLGTRQPDIYGTATIDDLAQAVRSWGEELGLSVTHFQSNHEGELIEQIHAAGSAVDGLILNAGAFTHYAYAVSDALEAVPVPAVEVHISNIREREGWRRRSVVSPAAVLSIHGRGISGYRWALLHLRNRLAMAFEKVAYGSFPDQVGDLRLPRREGLLPLAVLIHGGLWEEAWTRDTTEAWAVELAQRGWASFNLEYRRLGRGGGWPQSFADVRSGFEAAMGLPGIDPERVVVAGHSAGGTMALWLAKEELPTPPRRVVSVAGITDLVRARHEGLGRKTVDSLLGRRALQPEAISPLHRAPTGVPTRLLSCLNDDLVDLDYARQYALAASSEAELREVSSSHMAVIDPTEAAFGAAIDALTT